MSRSASPSPEAETIQTSSPWSCGASYATVALNHVTRGVVVTVRAELKQQSWVTDGTRRERVVITARSLGIIQNPVRDLGDIPDEPDEGELESEIAA